MKSKILFLHPNFPAQFKHIARNFAEQGNDVIFLCQTHYNRTIPGVKILTLKGRCGIEKLDEMKLNLIDRAYKISTQYLEAFRELERKNWEPNIIISHSAWGCGAYARQHWPKARIISYVEWWFNPNSELYTYDQENKELGFTNQTSTKHWLRNALISLEVLSADQLVCPTKWQKAQLPKLLQEKCSVIFDGIDLNKYNRTNIDNNESQTNSKNLVVTYGTRGMEPMRAFPQFIRSIPEVITHCSKDLTIEIAGNDEINYGGITPNEGSWKKWAIKYLKNKQCEEKVKWLGRLPEERYIKWLQNSNCHVYLSHPFVVSWSLIEAIQCCRKIVASDVEPVKEFYNMDNMLIVDHRNINAIAKAIIKQLEINKDTCDNFNSASMDELSIGTCTWRWRLVAGLDVTTLY